MAVLVVEESSSDGTRCGCMYEPPDDEAVRRAYRTTGVRFVGVWLAHPVGV
jgi:hypothetical protein